ncbi:hypothetical protein DTL42_00940 [Bremerella cremea]|uniref:Uncharacterized protein n=1 Tax=Bremerella cremea TaxID=1031537 RepID=A0A368KYW4_9BACT|nr:hypothetical protein [Bremerella cremea]RCS55987.1 hypothetical protein DTL42_00940 [Bremerella cremea]
MVTTFSSWQKFFLIHAGILLLLVIGASLPRESLGDDGSEISDEMFAFVQLSYFSNRGFMLGIYGVQSKDKLKHDLLNDIPEDLAEYLKPRKTNLLSEPAHTPWPSGTAESPHDIQVTLEVLAEHGFVELFRHQNARLFDSPLETRSELMKQLQTISEQMNVAYAGLIGGRLTRDEHIILAGQMRKLSVDFDLAVLMALSPEERQRVGQLVKQAMPVALESIQRNHKQLGPFGFKLDEQNTSR